ncbi:MAG: prepilin-type N-terminal cleavage/methylation domain-containing protein [Phycisphaerae bacterium]|nr:prepilin-type N-terminal cleavage/methylation domain-containing protein [Phycisphaerae bacterium]
MRQKQGFTLIELLVVIAIIALLLAVLMPSLKTAKKIAQSIVCSSNCKTLSLGATLFANDNDDAVPLSGPTPTAGKLEYTGWVLMPRDENGVRISNMNNATYEDRTRGIMAGSLYPYVDAFESYNCPGDKRFKGTYGNYLSYAMPGCLRPDSTNTKKYISKLSQIILPSEKYIFLEESDPRSYVAGNWGLGVPEDGHDGWWDGLAIWHNNSSTFGFAEGHKWRDDYTRERAGWTVEDLRARGGAFGHTDWPHPDYKGVRNDLDWMQAHWPFAR